MSKQDKKNLMPELRFPEFKGIGGWEKLSLIQLAKFRRGSFPQPYGLSKWFNDENGMPFIQVFDVNNNLQLKPTTKRRISKLAAEQSVFILKGTLIVTLQGSIGRVAITQYDAYVDRTILIFEEFHKPTEKLFFAYIIQNLFELEKERAPGGIIKTITKEVLSDFTVRVPQFPEQQKIADCLSSLDELISAHIQKHEALQSYKKGLMQNLFPAEGETVPAWRFSEFENAEAWRKGITDNLAVLTMGYAFKSTDFMDEGIQLVRMGNLYQGVLKFDRSPVFLPTNYEEEYSRFVIKPCDLLMSMTGTAGKEDYGFVVQVPTESPNLLLNQRIVKISPKKDCIKGFLLQTLKSENFLKKLYKLPGGTKQANLSAQQLKELDVYFPDVREQQKIADCLSSIDNLITAQAQKIEVLKVHKKGLMQQIFPTVED